MADVEEQLLGNRSKYELTQRLSVAELPTDVEIDLVDPSALFHYQIDPIYLEIPVLRENNLWQIASEPGSELDEGLYQTDLSLLLKNVRSTDEDPK